MVSRTPRTRRPGFHDLSTLILFVILFLSLALKSSLFFQQIAWK